MKKIVIILLFAFLNCKQEAYEFTEIACEMKGIAANTSIETVKEIYSFGGPVQIEEDLIIEGYVVSEDRNGNFYKSLSIQDKPENPSFAISLSIDATNLYTKYEVGRKVLVKLKGLAIGNQFGRIRIGQIKTGELVGISSFQFEDYIVKSCDLEEIVPLEIELSELNEDHLDMLVSISNAQFGNEELGKAYGNPDSNKSVDRILEGFDSSCESLGELNLRTSGFASFKNESVPEGSGTIEGVLQNYYSDLQLVLRSSRDVSFINERCELKQWKATTSIGDLRAVFQGELVEFGSSKDLIVEGFVISSDVEGNFRNRLVIQDSIRNPDSGIQVLLEKEHLFEQFSVGERVQLKLNRLYMDMIEGLLTVGVHDSGGIGFIAEEHLDDFIQGTKEIHDLEPVTVNLESLINSEVQGILVQVENVQLDSLDLGKAFTYFSGNDDGIRSLVQCNSFNVLQVYTSGKASFANEEFPRGNGSITGVLGKYLEIRTQDDILFDSPYEFCDPVIPPVLITEIADPVNNAGARYVELYNSGEHSISLKNWKLEKYLNGSLEVSGGSIDLSEIVLKPNSYVVIANTDFEAVFGIAPTISSTYISGNGDDVYRLINHRGEPIDIYGVLGEDGSGKNWEYLDGGSVRKNTVKKPSKYFNFEEWIISTKSKNFSVHHPNTPKYAPKDYAPFSE